MGRKLENRREILQGHARMEGSAPRFNHVESYGKGQRCSREKPAVCRARARYTLPGSWPYQSSGPSTHSWCSMSILLLLLQQRHLMFLCKESSKGEERGI